MTSPNIAELANIADLGLGIGRGEGLETVDICDFDAQLIDTAPEFMDVFGEQITYIPGGGGQRQIKAIVDRESPDRLDGAPHGLAPLIYITVINDPVKGISSSEINTGRDKVKLSVRWGRPPEERPINAIINHDAGMMKVQVR